MELTAAGDPAPEACLGLARWVADKDLPALYGLALRWTLLLDGDQPEARRRIRELRARLARLPDRPALAQRLRDDMGPSFRVIETEHFRIAYETAPSFARRTGALLERVYREFFRFFRDRFFEPVPPADRLEVVLFATREGYRRFVAPFGPAFRNTAGVYSSKYHRSYFYDAQSDPSRARAQRRLADARARLETLEHDVLEKTEPGDRFRVETDDGKRRQLSVRETRALVARQKKRLQRTAQRIDQRFRRLNVARAVHEITHHLAYAAGIHTRHHPNPRWLVEGLAMYFEATVEGQWIGPGHIDSHRLARFQRRIRAGTWFKLERLISSDAPFTDGGPVTAEAYDAAWALFTYLARVRHDRLFDYLANLSLRVSQAPYPPRDRRRDVERLFGPLRVLERAWLRHLEAIPGASHRG